MDEKLYFVIVKMDGLEIIVKFNVLRVLYLVFAYLTVRTVIVCVFWDLLV